MSDVIVIGAGHNGLVAALRLARAGRRVTVLEARARAGGLCAPREFHPGYTAPGVLHDTASFRPAIADALDLARHGLELRDEPPALAVDRNACLRLARDPAASDLPDADAYRRWREYLGRVRGFVASVLAEPPPSMDISSLGGLWKLAKRGFALRRLGRADMVELMRVAPMCVADWLQEHFESQLLCEALSGSAVLSSYMGPWSAGSAFQLLVTECTAGRAIAGGPAGLIDALLAGCRTSGVEVRTGAAVRRIKVENGRVGGVELESGEAIGADCVAASCDPKTTLLRLLHPADLPRRVEEQVRVLRTRGTTAKVHLALSGPLELTHAPGAAVETLRVCGGHLDELERAFDAVKYRRFSERPHLDVRVPTVETPGLAPEGHHVVSILASFAPYDLEGGWTSAACESLADRVVDRLAEVAPSVKDRIAGREVLTPADLEREYGLTGGHLFHGEHALDQMLFLRPAPSCAQHATPIEGLYLCGSGSHPGGGVTGVPGWLGAGRCLTPFGPARGASSR